MPHLRERHAEDLFERLLGFSPIVGIFGHRQVGKTTFLEKNANDYLTFDQVDSLELAEADISAFVSSLSKNRCAIDEAQLVPKLFPTLKEWVRTHKKPGQFILSGSVRFSSRKAIRESLTGRIMAIELLPMVLTELDGAPLGQATALLMGQKNFETWANQIDLKKGLLRSRAKLIERYLDHGGLPGVCFIRDPKFRSDKIREQLHTILDRDIRLVYPTTLTLRELENYVRTLASHDGEILRLSLLRSETKLSEATQKKVIQALEAVFLIRLLPVEGDRKGLVAVFEDQAEVKYLNQGSSPVKTQLAHLVYRNIRAQFTYIPGENVSFFQYRTRGGVVVPVAIRTSQGELGIIACEGDQPSRKDLFAAQSFIRQYGTGKCIFVTRGHTTVKAFARRILQVPAEWLLFE